MFGMPNFVSFPKRLLVFQWKYTKTPMSKFECFGHAVKGQCYSELEYRVRAIILPEIKNEVDNKINVPTKINGLCTTNLPKEWCKESKNETKKLNPCIPGIGSRQEATPKNIILLLHTYTTTLLPTRIF